MSTECSLIHSLAQGLERHRFPFQDARIPLNGIYLLFENGEQGHGGDRIVRIGSHTGINQLRPRLKQHFVIENKDRSIFRKNIGRAQLNQDNSPFLAIWNRDRTSRNARRINLSRSELAFQQEIETAVSRRIQQSFSFVVIGVNDKRLDFERKLISTISHCNECAPSHKWFGKHSPISKIVKSGLWQVQGLNGTTLTSAEIETLQT